MTGTNLKAWVWAITRLWLVTIEFENKCFVTNISSKINYSNVCVQKTYTCRCSHALGDLKVVIVDKIWKEISFFTKISLKNISICVSRRFVLAHVGVMLWEIWRLWLLMENVKRNNYITKILYLPLYKSTLFIGTQSCDFTYFWSTTWFRNLIILLKHNCVEKNHLCQVIQCYASWVKISKIRCYAFGIKVFRQAL